MAYRSFAIDYLSEEEGYGLFERIDKENLQTHLTDKSVSSILKHVVRHLDESDDLFIPELIAEVLDIESSHNYNAIMKAIKEEQDAVTQAHNILSAIFESMFKSISESVNHPGGEVMGIDEVKETVLPNQRTVDDLQKPDHDHDLEGDVDDKVQREYWKNFNEWKQEEQKRNNDERNEDNDV